MTPVLVYDFRLQAEKEVLRAIVRTTEDKKLPFLRVSFNQLKRLIVQQTSEAFDILNCYDDDESYPLVTRYV